MDIREIARRLWPWSRGPQEYNVLVTVDTTDVEQGVPLDSMRCPVARAVQRVLPEAESIYVTQGLVTVKMRNQWWTAPMPSSARNFVTLFDLEHYARPIAFELTFTAFTIRT